MGDVLLNPRSTLPHAVLPLDQNPGSTSSELTRQMATALDGSGKRIFSAYATKLNAMHGVTVLDRNGNAVSFAANVANTIYHQFDKPLIFIKRPGSASQYFLFTQVSDGVSDFLYRHTLDASLPGSGSLEEPLGVIIETNHLQLTNNNALRYGVSVQAIQNSGGINTTWMYFLRSSATQVQLTARVVNSNGSFGSSLSVGAINGTAIGKIKYSPDGKQLLYAYLPPPVLNQIQFSRVRRYGIGPNGELALLEEKALSKDLLEFEFSPDGRFIYYGLSISVTPVGFTKQAARPGTKFRIRRWDIFSQSDELVGDSYNDEIFNGKNLALQRSANGRIYVSAAGHRRMMVINDPSSTGIPTLSGEVIADNDPNKAPYLSGAFATIAFDHHFHSIPNNGTFYATRNKRQYELKDHLGNVNAVVSDMRATDGSAVVVSANNYYPFGMIMPGRSYNSADYRYGFNGMEKDDEIKGTGNSYDFGARLYDPRVGRWLTRDPLAEEFAGWSDYNAFADNPILYVDPDGRKFINAFDERVERQQRLVAEMNSKIEYCKEKGIKVKWLERRSLRVAKRELRSLMKSQEEVNQLFMNLKNSNKGEYDYFEGLTDSYGTELTISVDLVDVPYDGTETPPPGIGGDYYRGGQTEVYIEPIPTYRDINNFTSPDNVTKVEIKKMANKEYGFEIIVYQRNKKAWVTDDQLFSYFNNELGDVKFLAHEIPVYRFSEYFELWDSGSGYHDLYWSNERGGGHYSREYQKDRDQDFMNYKKNRK